MKSSPIFLITFFLAFSAEAQYALQIGTKIIPVTKEVTLSKRELLSDTVRVLYIPDTAKGCSGMKAIMVVYSGKSGEEAHSKQLMGNVICPVLNEEIRRKETQRVCIAQVITAETFVVKPIWILVNLVP